VKKEIPVNPLLVDSHIHLDIVCAQHPDKISWFTKIRCLPLSWAHCREVTSAADIERYLRQQAETIAAITAAGLPCRYLTGIHPRNITPDMRPEMIHKLLAPYLDDPLCLGVGEIGLETGSAQEKELLHAQLELSEEVTRRNKVFGVHTPRKNKSAITREILAMLESFRHCCNSIVVDHCSEETIGSVLEMGFWSGITLSPVKTSPYVLADIIGNQSGQTDRIMLNSDSGMLFHEDLYRFYCSGNHCSREVKLKLLRDNALRFLTRRTEHEHIS
jgi:uncharacterized protein